MTRYVGLIRGINVGRNKMVAMADLRQMLTDLRMDRPKTLLASGNMVFGSRERTPAELETWLETETEVRLGTRSEYHVRSADEWDAIIAANPFPEFAVADPSHLVVMFLKSAPDPDELREVQAAITGRECIAAVGRELFITYPDGIGNSTLHRSPGFARLTKLGTGRNWNTVLKLQMLVRE